MAYAAWGVCRVSNAMEHPLRARWLHTAAKPFMAAPVPPTVSRIPLPGSANLLYRDALATLLKSLSHSAMESE